MAACRQYASLLFLNTNSRSDTFWEQKSWYVLLVFFADLVLHVTVGFFYVTGHHFWNPVPLFLIALFAVCKDSYVILACGFDRNGKWSGFCKSRNVMTLHHIKINDITYMETGVCRQHYSMNNRLIFLCCDELPLNPFKLCLPRNKLILLFQLITNKLSINISIF